MRTILALVAVVVVAFWAWTARGSWGDRDVEVESWSAAFSPYLLLAALPLLGLAPLLIGRRRRRRASGATTDPLALTTGWACVVLSLAAIVLTAGVLVVDAVRAPWTPARQNLQALAGDDRCGLLRRVIGRTELVDRIADPRVPTLVAPRIAPFFPCARQPSIHRGLLEVPQRLVLESDRWPITARDSAFADVPDLYTIRGVGHGPAGIGVLAVDEGIRGYSRVPARRISRTS